MKLKLGLNGVSYEHGSIRVRNHRIKGFCKEVYDIIQEVL